ncbi:MAG: uroporphyrinogen-III C-methyltransferase [Desulfobacterales bacterium]|jgi:uroporphyrinogen III methyltransferase/synthase
MRNDTSTGKVYLVGAGPGDAGLITVKGLECIQKADVIIYDYLAASVLLKNTRKDAELIYVGKKGGDHTLAQEKINELMVKKARTGATVARLKGGDPFIFGRGGEEAEVLYHKGISFEVVPGVTSAIAAPAYAGIPLTHRKYASTLAFVTGHEDPAKADSSIDWASIAKGIGTVVFLMGVKNLPHICTQLLKHGKPPKTPVALVRWGTTPRQITVCGTLDTIVAKVEKTGLKAPAIIIVGDVVRLRPMLKWYEDRPLLGKKIVVTRARAQSSDLVRHLSDLGAECLEFPTIKIQPVKDWTSLDNAIHNLAAYDWLIFTSVNGVTFFFERLLATGRDVRALCNLRIASIGPATEQRISEFGLNSDIVPESYRAESVVAAFAHQNVKPKRILLPRAREARPVLPLELTKMGARIDEITVYETTAAGEDADQLIKHLEEKSIDLITFTSSSTVKNFKALIPAKKFKNLLDGVIVASIGPVTSDTAKDLGFEVHITAEVYTIAGLCQVIQQYYAKNP